jgi:hypothetical protein
MDGQDRRAAKSFLDHWQLIIMLLAGAIACVKFYFTVQDLSIGQKKWQESSETRREKSRDENEAIRTRLTKLEQWREDQHEKLAH